MLSQFSFFGAKQSPYFSSTSGLSTTVGCLLIRSATRSTFACRETMPEMNVAVCRKSWNRLSAYVMNALSTPRLSLPPSTSLPPRPSVALAASVPHSTISGT